MVLAATERSGLLELLEKTKGRMRKNTDAYCNFRSAYDYSTEHCFDLMNQLERLARNGKIDRFLQKTEASRYPRPDQREELKFCPLSYSLISQATSTAYIFG